MADVIRSTYARLRAPLPTTPQIGVLRLRHWVADGTWQAQEPGRNPRPWALFSDETLTDLAVLLISVRLRHADAIKKRWSR